jgi:hypothetical protein
MRSSTAPGAPQRAATCRAVLPRASVVLASAAVQVKVVGGWACGWVRMVVMRWWMQRCAGALLQQARTRARFSWVWVEEGGVVVVVVWGVGMGIGMGLGGWGVAVGVWCTQAVVDEG